MLFLHQCKSDIGFNFLIDILFCWFIGVFICYIIPSWNVEMHTIMSFVTLYESIFPMQGYGHSCVWILVNGFFHCCQEIFKAFERLEICTFWIPSGRANINYHLVLILHLDRPCSTCAAYLPKVLQPYSLYLYHTILHLVFYEQVLWVQLPRLLYHKIDKATECGNVKVRTAREWFYL